MINSTVEGRDCFVNKKLYLEEVVRSYVKISSIHVEITGG